MGNVSICQLNHVTKCPMKQILQYMNRFYYTLTWTSCEREGGHFQASEVLVCTICYYLL